MLLYREGLRWRRMGPPKFSHSSKASKQGTAGGLKLFVVKRLFFLDIKQKVSNNCSKSSAIKLSTSQA